MGEISIRVSIAGRNYPLTIDHSEESVLRKAEASIENSISLFQQNYAVKDKQDLLAMAALQAAARGLGESSKHTDKKQATAVVDDFTAELQRIENIADSYLDS